jgi:hypothetical protein
MRVRMMRFFNSRKAAVELSLQQIIGLVIAVVVVLATVGLFFGLMSIFTSPPGSGSAATLNIVYEISAAMFDPHNQNTSCFLRAEYVQVDWTIVGFNSDGVLSGTVSSIMEDRLTCSVNNDCVYENCGDNDEIEKPSSCGNGPCLCLCEGAALAGVGDVDGDDCKESGAVCRKFPRSIGFTTFYLVESERGECANGGGPQGNALCDMFIDSEDCGGTDRRVGHTLIISKGRNMDGNGEALLFDIIDSSDFDRPDVQADYPGMTSCRQMVRDLREFQANLPPPEAPAAPGEQPREDVLTRDINTVRVAT